LSHFQKQFIERKQAEEMLRHTANAAPDATVVVNEDGNIILVNKQLENVFGHARQDLIGTCIQQLQIALQ